MNICDSFTKDLLDAKLKKILNFIEKKFHKKGESTSKSSTILNKIHSVSFVHFREFHSTKIWLALIVQYSKQIYLTMNTVEISVKRAIFIILISENV